MQDRINLRAWQMLTDMRKARDSTCLRPIHSLSSGLDHTMRSFDDFCIDHTPERVAELAEKLDGKLPKFMQSHYRFPLSIWYTYLRPKTYTHAITWFYQRGTRGFSDQDEWSFDCYLLNVLIGYLKKAEGGFSYPSELDSFETWQEIMQEIREGFEFYQEVMFDWEHYEDFEFASEAFDKSWTMLGIYFGSLWD